MLKCEFCMASKANGKCSVSDLKLTKDRECKQAISRMTEAIREVRQLSYNCKCGEKKSK